METLHHVHADDVAQAFMKAIVNRSSAIGESFHICSPQAITLRGFAHMIARHYGVEVKIYKVLLDIIYYHSFSILCISLIISIIRILLYDRVD